MTSNKNLKEILLKTQSDISVLNKILDSIESDIKVLNAENAKLSKEMLDYKQKYSVLKTNNTILFDKIVICESKIGHLLNKERENNLVLFKVKGEKNLHP